MDGNLVKVLLFGAQWWGPRLVPAIHPRKTVGREGVCSRENMHGHEACIRMHGFDGKSFPHRL